MIIIKQVIYYFDSNQLHVKSLEMHRSITEILNTLPDIVVSMYNQSLIELGQFYSDMNLQMIHYLPIN